MAARGHPGLGRVRRPSPAARSRASCLVASRPWGEVCWRRVRMEGGGSGQGAAMEWFSAPADEVQLRGWAQGMIPLLVWVRRPKVNVDKRCNAQGWVPNPGAFACPVSCTGLPVRAAQY